MEGLTLERIAAEKPRYEFWCGHIGEKTFAVVLQNHDVEWWGDDLNERERDGVMAELAARKISA